MSISNHIDDHFVADRPVDPGAIIGGLIVVILETGSGEDSLEDLAILGQDVKIDILGVAPYPRVDADGETAADREAKPGLMTVR